MSYYKNKGFFGGEKGHVHLLQEVGYVAAVAGFGSWLVSPLFGFVVAGYILLRADQYWFEREIDQSLMMDRPFEDFHLDRENLEKNDFFTQDAVDDVEFPAKFRPVTAAIGVALCIWIYKGSGICGILLYKFGWCPV